MATKEWQKLLYKVKLNWYGEVHEFYTHAYSKDQAYSNACHQLSDLVGYSWQFITRFCMTHDRKEVMLMKKE